MTSYRFLGVIGDVVEEGDFDDHAAALAWARDGDHDEDVQRVEYLGPQRDWRWAGADPALARSASRSAFGTSERSGDRQPRQWRDDAPSAAARNTADPRTPTRT